MATEKLMRAYLAAARRKRTVIPARLPARCRGLPR